MLLLPSLSDGVLLFDGELALLPPPLGMLLLPPQAVSRKSVDISAIVIINDFFNLIPPITYWSNRVMVIVISITINPGGGSTQ